MMPRHIKKASRKILKPPQNAVFFIVIKTPITFIWLHSTPVGLLSYFFIGSHFTHPVKQVKRFARLRVFAWRQPGAAVSEDGGRFPN
jgi:hypothetical protein